MATPREAYVWVWLKQRTEPVVAGRLVAQHDRYVFTYGRSYLQRPDAISLYEPELPLLPGVQAPSPPLALASALRDAAPDAWGRRVIINRLTGLWGDAAHEVELDELTFLLESGSDRVGALDFQGSPTHYDARATENPPLDELLRAAELVDQGSPLTPELAVALQHGTALGGARPKALVQTNDRKFVAKFSSSSDSYDVVRAEYVAMRLAALAGLDVAKVQLTQSLGREVLLVERFDRSRTPSGWVRRPVVSALTIFGLDELMAAHASYEELADIVRLRFTSSRSTLRELFGRLVFNILVGNTDDHARNHAAFWDGYALTLTPAYDLCPQRRSGREASQGMLIRGRDRRSQLRSCFAAASGFQLSMEEARHLAAAMVTCIRQRWDEVCDSAGLGLVNRRALWRRQFLNPFAFEGVEDELGQALGGL